MACVRLLFLFAAILTTFPPSHAGEIATYWGQNAKEGNLSAACATGIYSYINLAFLNVFGNGQAPKINFTGHCNRSTGGCKALGSEIVNCQKNGVKVLLSIGGSAGSYKLSSKADANKVGSYLWKNFLGGTSTSGPLGSAALDGVDFHIAMGSGRYYADLAKYLRRKSTRGGRKVYLTAAPRCSFPDARVGKSLQTGFFDNVWVQFFDNPSCQYDSGNITKLLRSWSSWNSSVNAGKFFLGLPASKGAARSGYVLPGELAWDVLPRIKPSRTYGGVALWSRYEDEQSGYSSIIKNTV